MADIYDLSSKAKLASKDKEVSGPRVEENVIKVLESLLEKAKAGELHELVAVGSSVDGKVARVHAGLVTDPFLTSYVMKYVYDEYCFVWCDAYLQGGTEEEIDE